MNINFTRFSFINTLKQDKPQFTPAFGSAKTRKLVEEIKNTKNLKNLHLTFDDVVDVYYDLGYDVIFKGGSHAVVPVTDKVNLPIIIPHGGYKLVHPTDIKRLQYVINGEIEKALKVH